MCSGEVQVEDGLVGLETVFPGGLHESLDCRERCLHDMDSWIRWRLPKML